VVLLVMANQTVLITGGNTGIGLATAGQLGQRGYQPIITSRNSTRGEAALRELQDRYGVKAQLLSLDLASFESICLCAEEVLDRHGPLSLLINNAGIALSERRETAEGFEYTFGVNYLGAVLLTRLLLERVKVSAPARIIFLSSAAHVGARQGMDWDDLDRRHKYDGQAYCQAKLALIYYARELAQRVRNDQISVFSVNPGFVATEFGMNGDISGWMSLLLKAGRPWMAAPDQGARSVVFAATEPGLEAHSGGYIKDSKIASPSGIALDEHAQKRMWQVTEQLFAQTDKKTRPIRVRQDTAERVSK
jgi:NAD(P)-dependent dehydrogenase (short-subunit alcohol dehydrogenase family)